MSSPFTQVVLSVQWSAEKTLRRETHKPCRRPWPVQRCGAGRGLRGEDGDDLVELAVGGGTGDPVITPARGDIGAVAEPAQAKHRLPVAGQGPAVGAGTAPAALGVEQPAHVLGQFTRGRRAWLDR